MEHLFSRSNKFLFKYLCSRENEFLLINCNGGMLDQILENSIYNLKDGNFYKSDEHGGVALDDGKTSNLKNRR